MSPREGRASAAFRVWQRDYWFTAAADAPKDWICLELSAGLGDVVRSTPDGGFGSWGRSDRWRSVPQCWWVEAWQLLHLFPYWKQDPHSMYSLPFHCCIVVSIGEKAPLESFLTLWLFHNLGKLHPLAGVNKTNSFVVYTEIINSRVWQLCFVVDKIEFRAPFITKGKGFSSQLIFINTQKPQKVILVLRQKAKHQVAAALNSHKCILSFLGPILYHTSCN